MSSGDEGNTPLTKKRKLQRACDYCRRKKIKCDGPDMPNHRCSRCSSRRVECTYKEAFSKINYPSSYVENLESRLERMERLVNQLCPDGNIPKDVDGSQPTADASANTHASAASRSTSAGPERLRSLSPSSLGLSPHSPAGSDPPEPDTDGEDADADLTEGLRKLSIETHPFRFHGRSAGMILLREARTMAVGSPWGQEKGHYRHKGLRSPIEESVFKDFPPEDLMDTLIDLYFRKLNDMQPLLHEPMFKRSIQEGLHLRNGGFGATVLLVCANAARFIRDPRVLLDGSDDWHSAGWRWYQQVEDTQKLSLSPAKLYDLQLCVLMGHFLGGSTAPQAAWTLLGNGIRRAVDVGAHRRKVYNTKPTIEDELWKRAFWCLVIAEWTHSYGLGRPSGIHDEDIDVMLPIPIDDEYWSPPGNDVIPQQPEGKPSKIASMVALIRLSQILAFATRTLYPTNKSKHTDSAWQQRIVAELDSALNKWVDTLPSHLRWDPHQEDPLYLMQSVSLMGHYYQVQIAVHRPFLSAAYRDSPLSFPSVIMCNNAARSTVQILDVVHKRLGTLYQGTAGLLYMSGAVLMRSIWGQRRSGRTVNVDRDVVLMKKAIEMLETIQYDTYVAASGRDYLTDLMSGVYGQPEPQTTPVREDPGGPVEHTSTSVPPSLRAAAHVPLPEAAEHHTRARMSFLASMPIGQRTQESISSGSSGHGMSHPASFWAGQQGMQRAEHGSNLQQSYVGMPAGCVQTQSVGTSHANLGVGSMFGLEPLGYSEAVSLFPSSGNVDASVSGIPPVFQAGAGPGYQGTSDIPDLAVLNDTLSVWTNGPASFGWDEWGAYFKSTNDRALNPGI